MNRQTYNGRVSAHLLLTGLLFLLAWGFVWWFFTYDISQPIEGYLCLQPELDQTVCLQFGREGMRTADSPKALENAVWIRPSRNFFDSTFPPVEIPLSAEASDGVLSADRAHIDLHGRHARLIWDLQFEDGEGVIWTVEAGRCFNLSDTLAETETEQLPKLGTPVLEISTEIKNNRDIEIAVALESKGRNELDIFSLERNQHSAELELEVLDSEGKIVDTATGALDDFGYT